MMASLEWEIALKKQPDEKSQPVIPVKKETFWERMARGFHIFREKMTVINDGMNRANDQQKKQDTVTGIDMSYAPKELQ